MGTAFVSGSSNDESSCGTPVILNVYDLTPLNDYLYWCGLGIFHSGIEVHGSEYGFGGHDFPTSAVFETFLESMVSEYYGDTYHVISKNCNHFTEDICWRLTGKKIPGWINRLAQLGAMCNCLLPESLRLPTFKQIPEYHILSGY